MALEAFPPLVLVAVVFLLDGLGVPLMPEIAVLIAYNLNPTPEWGLLLLAVVTLMEVLAGALLYATARWVGLPKRLERFLAGYSKSLLVSDERLLLLNRVIPVLPMSGAFIHIRGWPRARCFWYLAIGSAAKYGLLLLLAGVAYGFFEDGWALGIGLGLAGAFLAVSWGFALRRWWTRPEAA